MVFSSSSSSSEDAVVSSGECSIRAAASAVKLLEVVATAACRKFLNLVTKEK